MPIDLKKEKEEARKKIYLNEMRIKNEEMVDKVFNNRKVSVSEMQNQICQTYLRQYAKRFKSNMIKRLEKKGYIGKNEYYKIENQQI